MAMTRPASPKTSASASTTAPNKAAIKAARKLERIKQRLSSGLKAYQADDHYSALTHLRKLLILDPHHNLGHYLLANCMHHLRRQNSTLNHFYHYCFSTSYNAKTNADPDHAGLCRDVRFVRY